MMLHILSQITRKQYKKILPGFQSFLAQDFCDTLN